MLESSAASAVSARKDAVPLPPVEVMSPAVGDVRRSLTHDFDMVVPLDDDDASAYEGEGDASEPPLGASMEGRGEPRPYATPLSAKQQRWLKQMGRSWSFWSYLVVTMV